MSVPPRLLCCSGRRGGLFQKERRNPRGGLKRQSQAAERMGRDFMAYRLGQVKSHIYNFYFKNNHTL